MVVLTDILKDTPAFSKTKPAPALAVTPTSFAEFRRAFKGDLVASADADYEDAIARWAASAVRRALIVAFTRDSADVALAVAFARTSGLSIAVRGGAHNVCAASSTDGGLVIDLSRYMNGCRIDAANKLAYVDGGAVWRAVDEAAIKHGLATVGGNVNHIGVGGLTLGGGYGYLSSLHGLAIDNLVKATVITANAVILTASETENSDLFWAIRGGGGNFGVISEFVFRLHEQRRTVYSGTMIFPELLVDQVVQVTADWWKKSPGPKSALLQTIRRGPAPDYAPYIEVIPFYNGTVEEGREEFKAFLDLNPIDMTGETLYEHVNSLQNADIPHGQSVYTQGAKQLTYSSTVAKRAFAQLCSLTNPDSGMRMTLTFELYPLDKIASVRTDATAFGGRGTGSNVLCVCAWDDAAPEAAVRAREATRAMTDVVASAETDTKASLMRAYANYDGDETQDTERVRTVFGENYPRLQAIKKKYDPNMVFSKWFAISPA